MSSQLIFLTLWTLIVFFLYYWIIETPLFKKTFQNELLFHVVRRTLGAILFISGPIILLIQGFYLHLWNKFITINNLSITFMLIGLLVSLILVVNWFNSKKASNLIMYPQVRLSEWSPLVFFASALSWVLYLLGYELLFRGWLFFGALEEMGLIWATVLNVILYALVHIPKGMKETLASILFGIVICYVSYVSGSFWVAFIVHVTLALSNEWMSLFFQKEMKLKWK